MEVNLTFWSSMKINIKKLCIKNWLPCIFLHFVFALAFSNTIEVLILDTRTSEYFARSLVFLLLEAFRLRLPRTMLKITCNSRIEAVNKM